MSVAEAWRLLADTNHLNHGIGLPAVDFSPLDGAGGFTRRAQATAFRVVRVKWKEYPFDWVRERSYKVRREFQSGPVAVLEGGVELQPQGDRVRVRAFADFTPANWTGRLAWRMGTATVDGVLAFCDHYLARRAAGKADPIPVPAERPQVDEARLDRLLARLAEAPVRRELLPLLRERVLEGSDDQVAGVRPYTLAASWGVDGHEVLRLLLHATRAGLFELRWEVMCPYCRVPKAEVPTLSQLPDRFHCETCGIAYDLEFDQRVELRFTVHPSVRQAVDSIYCIGGPLRTPHVVAQQYLRPHEERQVEVELTRPLRLRAVAGSHRLELEPGPDRSRPAELKITYADGRWSGPHSLVEPEKGALLVPGGAALRLRNQTGGTLLAVLEEVEWSGEATTAAQVTALQEFRDLFSAEVLAPGQRLAVRDISLLFSDLKGSTSLYEGVGDSAAYSRVNRHFEFIRVKVGEHRGAIVKTMGDAVMGAFHSFADAAAAALSIQRGIAAWCEEQEIRPPLTIKLGVHHGPLIAVSANDRLDYFGRTVNVAARLWAESEGADIVFLRDVFEELEPGSELRSLPSERLRTRLRGVEGERDLVRVRVGEKASEAGQSRPAHARRRKPA